MPPPGFLARIGHRNPSQTDVDRKANYQPQGVGCCKSAKLICADAQEAKEAASHMAAWKSWPSRVSSRLLLKCSIGIKMSIRSEDEFKAAGATRVVALVKEDLENEVKEFRPAAASVDIVFFLDSIGLATSHHLKAVHSAQPPQRTTCKVTCHCLTIGLHLEWLPVTLQSRVMQMQGSPQQCSGGKVSPFTATPIPARDCWERQFDTSGLTGIVGGCVRNV